MIAVPFNVSLIAEPPLSAWMTSPTGSVEPTCMSVFCLWLVVTFSL
jgi:hypothetical protein